MSLRRLHSRRWLCWTLLRLCVRVVLLLFLLRRLIQRGHHAAHDGRGEERKEKRNETATTATTTADRDGSGEEDTERGREVTVVKELARMESRCDGRRTVETFRSAPCELCASVTLARLTARRNAHRTAVRLGASQSTPHHWPLLWLRARCCAVYRRDARGRGRVRARHDSPSMTSTALPLFSSALSLLCPSPARCRRIRSCDHCSLRRRVFPLTATGIACWPLVVRSCLSTERPCFDAAVWRRTRSRSSRSTRHCSARCSGSLPSSWLCRMQQMQLRPR